MNETETAKNETEAKPVLIKRVMETSVHLLDAPEPDSDHIKASREL